MIDVALLRQSDLEDKPPGTGRKRSLRRVRMGVSCFYFVSWLVTIVRKGKLQLSLENEVISLSDLYVIRKAKER